FSDLVGQAAIGTIWILVWVDCAKRYSTLMFVYLNRDLGRIVAPVFDGNHFNFIASGRLGAHISLHVLNLNRLFWSEAALPAEFFLRSCRLRFLFLRLGLRRFLFVLFDGFLRAQLGGLNIADADQKLRVVGGADRPASFAPTANSHFRWVVCPNSDETSPMRT